MRRIPTLILLAAILLLAPAFTLAHHGSAISYDTSHLWSTWALVHIEGHGRRLPTGGRCSVASRTAR